MFVSVGQKKNEITIVIYEKCHAQHSAQHPPMKAKLNTWHGSDAITKIWNIHRTTSQVKFIQRKWFIYITGILLLAEATWYTFVLHCCNRFVLIKSQSLRFLKTFFLCVHIMPFQSARESICMPEIEIMKKYETSKLFAFSWFSHIHIFLRNQFMFQFIVFYWVARLLCSNPKYQLLHTI